MLLTRINAFSLREVGAFHGALLPLTSQRNFFKTNYTHQENRTIARFFPFSHCNSGEQHWKKQIASMTFRVSPICTITRSPGDKQADSLDILYIKKM
jgi:hypothetical protein